MSEPTNRKAISHERIVDVASRAVRRLGYHGVNVTDVMREAGLTHGGFYAHFKSRDALLAEAVEKAGVQVGSVLRSEIGRLCATGSSPFRALLETYLSAGNVRECETACPVSVLAGDMFRQVPGVIEPSRVLIDKLHRLVQEVLPPTADPGAAWAVTSAMLGAVQLARALGDTAAANAVLADTKANLLARYEH